MEEVLAKAPPPFKIVRPSRLERLLKILIYGPYGVGKTTLAASACDVKEMCDVLMVDAEAGDLSITDKDVDVVRVQSLKETSSVCEFLWLMHRFKDDPEKMLDIQQQVLVGVKKETLRRFSTVIIDSLTEIVNFSMMDVLGIDMTDTNFAQETAIPEWAEYKKNYNRIMRMIRAFRDLPMHVIIVCSTNEKIDQAQRVNHAPNLTGKLSHEVQGFVDLVGFLKTGRSADPEVKEVIRRLQITPTARVAAKNRISGLKEEFIQQPTMADIYNATKGDG